MIEPPRKVRIIRVFEIDNGVFVAVEQAVFEDLAGPVRHAGITKFRVGIDGSADKTAEKCSRRRAVEAVIVIEDS